MNFKSYLHTVHTHRGMHFIILRRQTSTPVKHIMPATSIPAAESATSNPGNNMAVAMEPKLSTEEKESDR